MDLNHCSFVQLLILAIGLGCVRICAQRTPDEWPFPECDTQNCGMVGCREVRIPFSQMDAGYSPLNVICIDKASPDSYLLNRCPDGFYNTFQNTSGVCSITIPGGNGTYLLFRANESATGLHPIDCNFNNSFVYSSVIVANDNTPYRDVLVYINNTWQQHHRNNTHVTVDVGDSLTVVFRGVGNISLNATNRINATDPRFLCKTDFACNMRLRLSDVSNRGMECSLRTPAELSDNGKILTVILNEMDQLNITITVRERALLPTSSTPSTDYPQPTSTGATAIISTNTDIEPTVTSDTTSSSVLLSSSMVQTSNTGLPGQVTPTIPPPSDKGSEGVPAGVIAAIIIAVIGGVILTMIGIIYYIHKKKRIRTKKLHDAAKHAEEATEAPPTTCSRSSSVRRSSITSRSMNDQQPSTSMDGPQSGATSMLHERLQDIEDKLEEVNTGVHALKIDKTNSLKRQTSAS